MEEDDELMYNEAVSDSIAVDQGVQIDWGAQIKAGGSMMYPLYLLGVIALVIAIPVSYTHLISYNIIKNLISIL